MPSTTRESQSALLQGRRLRTKLDACKPTLEGTAAQKQFTQMGNRKGCNRMFAADDPVLVRNFSDSPNWIEGTVMKQTGPVCYFVQVNTPAARSNWPRHRDQLIRRSVTTTKPCPVINPVFLPATADDDSSVLAGKELVTITGPAQPLSCPTSARRHPARHLRPPDRCEAQ